MIILWGYLIPTLGITENKTLKNMKDDRKTKNREIYQKKLIFIGFKLYIFLNY